MIGVYLITNLTTNKNYVGKSVEIEVRWKRHISDLNLNKHVNLDLQADWNKYGQDNFTFKILEVCSKDIITNRENHWIDIFNARAYGYNYDSRRPTKSTWGRKSKENALAEKLLEICSFYAKDKMVGVFYLDDICSYLDIKRNKQYEIIKILSKIDKKDFNKYNVYIQSQVCYSEDCITICKWSEGDFENSDVEIIDISDYIEYKKVS